MSNASDRNVVKTKEVQNFNLMSFDLLQFKKSYGMLVRNEFQTNTPFKTNFGLTTFGINIFRTTKFWNKHSRTTTYSAYQLSD